MENKILQKKDLYHLLIVMFLIVVTASVSIFSKDTERNAMSVSDTSSEDISVVDGITLPIEWGNLGVQMMEAGAIDYEKFVALYENRGGLSNDNVALLTKSNNGQLEINKENASVILNLLWAFGLSNTNPVLEESPMMDERYGGADRFASTGGWSLAKGNVMDHYGAHKFITLTDEQQFLVEEVSKNIYRPCCGNSTYFPDCNHGMAMLGLLELMAVQGATESELYKTALIVNRYWFPGAYATIELFFEQQGRSFADVSAKEILGADFSSARGYGKIVSKVKPQSASGTSCGV